MTSETDCQLWQPNEEGSDGNMIWNDYENEQQHQQKDKWDVKKSIRLLRLYGAHRCLWDVRDTNNRHRKLRKAALVDIATAMHADMTINQVVRKINVLRATYRYEKRRIKQRIRKGLGPKTKLKWFALADAFLRYLPRSGKSLKKTTIDSDSDLDDTIVFKIEPELLDPFEENKTAKSLENAVQTDQNLPRISALNIEENNNIKIDEIWDENCQFVNLLSSYSGVLQYSAENDEHNLALQAMSKEMQKPIWEVCKQIHIFKRIYTAEKIKTQISIAYKSPFKWWPLAKQLMDNMEQQKTKTPAVYNFIDINDLPPMTPMPCSVEANDIVEKSTKYVINGLEDNLLEGKWSLKYSVKFLRLYGSHRCLWDLNDCDYRSREMRAAAIEDIASAMGHGLSGDFVSKKIKIFRITYMQHRKRMIEAQKQGKQPNIQLLWFPLADSFLRKHIGLRSIGSAEPEIPQFEYQDVVTNLNLIDPALLTEFHGKGTQNTIEPPE